MSLMNSLRYERIDEIDRILRDEPLSPQEVKVLEEEKAKLIKLNQDQDQLHQNIGG